MVGSSAKSTGKQKGLGCEPSFQYWRVLVLRAVSAKVLRAQRAQSQGLGHGPHQLQQPRGLLGCSPKTNPALGAEQLQGRLALSDNTWS